jgi:hypothetical protein
LTISEAESLIPFRHDSFLKNKSDALANENHRESFQKALNLALEIEDQQDSDSEVLPSFQSFIKILSPKKRVSETEELLQSSCQSSLYSGNNSKFEKPLESGLLYYY